MTLSKRQDHQRTEELRQHQSQSALSTRDRRQESLKLDISTFHGVENDFLLRWFVEVDGAIKTRHIDNERMQVAFAQSYLAGDVLELGPKSQVTRPERVRVVTRLQDPAQ